MKYLIIPFLLLTGCNEQKFYLGDRVKAQLPDFYKKCGNIGKVVKGQKVFPYDIYTVQFDGKEGEPLNCPYRLPIPSDKLELVK